MARTIELKELFFNKIRTMANSNVVSVADNGGKLQIELEHSINVKADEYIRIFGLESNNKYYDKVNVVSVDSNSPFKITLDIDYDSNDSTLLIGKIAGIFKLFESMYMEIEEPDFPFVVVQTNAIDVMINESIESNPNVTLISETGVDSINSLFNLINENITLDNLLKTVEIVKFKNINTLVKPIAEPLGSEIIFGFTCEVNL